MRTMKDSGIEWIGEIPESWDICKLKYVVELRTEKTTNRADISQYIGLEHIESGFGRLIQDYTAITDFEGDTLNFYSGDVLFGKLRPYLSKVWMATCSGKCSSEFWVMNPNKVNGKYLFYSVLSNHFIANIDHSTYGVKMPRAEWNYAGNQRICLPKPDEQSIISKYIDKKCAEIDALIEAKEKTNALLKEQRQSIIYEAVTKGLDPNVPMKDSGIEWIGEIPENANLIRMKYIGDIFGRIGFRGYTQSDLVSEGEGPITLSPSNIGDSGMDYSKCTYLSWNKYEESPEIQIKNGDILMVKTGSSYGKSAIVEGLPMEATINPQFIVIKNIKYNPKYLCYYMQTELFKYQVEKAVVGGTIPTMAQEKINDFKIIIHDEMHCEKIVDYLGKKCAEIDDLIKANNTTIEKLKEYRKSVIFEAVTGKIEI